MMAGAGAEAFVRKQGLEIVGPAYFCTKERWEALQMAKREDSLNTKAGKRDNSGIVERSDLETAACPWR